ncbi:MAG: hypothetical protein U0U46_08100 [Saprospiraceae bacterium]
MTISFCRKGRSWLYPTADFNASALRGTPQVSGQIIISKGSSSQTVAFTGNMVQFATGIRHALYLLGLNPLDRTQALALKSIPLDPGVSISSGDFYTYTPNSYMLDFYPNAVPATTFRFVLPAGAAVSPSDFTVASDPSVPLGAEVYFGDKDLFIPLSYTWLDKLEEDFSFQQGGVYSHLISLKPFVSVDPSLDNLVPESPLSARTGVVYLQDEKDYWGVWHDLVNLWCLVKDDPQYINDPEYRFLEQHVLPGPGNTFHTAATDAFIILGSPVWSDYNKRESIKPEFFKQSLASAVPIDNSIGFINSNPLLSVLLHETNQKQKGYIMQDTHHTSIAREEELFDIVIANGVTHLYTFQVDIARNVREFFQNQPGLAVFYLSYYLDIMGINVD